jgi:eukaryotic-like serine/threonine-protein kinase
MKHIKSQPVTSMTGSPGLGALRHRRRAGRRDIVDDRKAALDQIQTADQIRTADATPYVTIAPGRLPPIDPARYQIVREFAHGGLGRILEVRDLRLGRVVALKEILRDSEGAYARFVREALITARLEHPAIIPVHDVGRWPSGEPFYSMKLVSGRSLGEVITATPELDGRLALLPNVIAVADAIAYAHSQGIIHRDLKPANVLVGEFGETVVIDWGIAKDLRGAAASELGPDPAAGASANLGTVSGEPSLTDTGTVLGTPYYMPPEQASGQSVDERADVYALGALLYEVLTGERPYRGIPEPLAAVLAGPPMPAEEREPAIPPDLATIARKAMARRPEDRYPSARELAEDLRRFQTGQLVSSHVYSRGTLIKRWLRRYRAPVIVAAVALTILAVVGVASVRRVIERAQTERRQRDLVLLQAVTSLLKDPTATLAWLKDYLIEDSDRAHILGVVDEAVALGVARHVLRPGDWVFDAAFTPDGKTLVAAVRDGVVRTYDLRTGEERKLGPAGAAIEALAMSPDGRFVVTKGMFGEVAVWPLDGAPARVLLPSGRPPVSKLSSSIKLSPDGTRVLVLREDAPPMVYPVNGAAPAPLGPPARARLVVADGDWSRQVAAESPNQVVAIEGETTRPLATMAKAIQQIAMSPRGDHVLIHDGEVVWIVPFTGGPLRKLVDYGARLAQAVWSPDERTIAFGGELHDLKLVEVATGAVRELRGHTDANYTLQWSRDGRRLLSASDDATARVWTVSDGSSIVLRGHDDDVYRARFSSDEDWVATASLDGSIRVWRVDQPGVRVLSEGAPIRDLKLKGGRALVRTLNEVAWWDLASGQRVPVFSWAGERGFELAQESPDGEHLFVLNAGGTAELRHRAGPPTILRGHLGVIDAVEYSRDSRYLYTASRDATLRRWDVATGEGRILFEGGAAVRRFAVAADGRVAFLHGDAMKMIAPDGAVTVLGSGPKWVGRVEFERVKDRMVLYREDWSLALIDASGRVIELRTGNYPVRTVVVSPDGTRIAGAVTDRTVVVWSMDDGRVLDVLRGHTDAVLDVVFSPDGALVATASWDKTVRIWKLETCMSRVLRGHAAQVDRIAWTRPEQLVTGSRDGTLRVWDVPSLELPASAELMDRLQRATTTRIGVDHLPTTGVPSAR